MGLFPAATFGQYDTGRQPRLAMQAGWGSPLYVIHKDVTKTVEEPNTINEIITGSEADAQYSVILDVPPGARGFIPFSILNYTVAATTDVFATSTLTVVGASTNPLRYMFVGRSPLATDSYAYDPSTVAMTSAVAPGTTGYWHALGAWRLAAATGGGGTNIFNYYSDNSAAAPANFGIATAASNGLTRTSIASLLRGGSVNTAPVFETLLGHSSYAGSISSTVLQAFGDNLPYIPLCGCDKLTCFAALGTSAPTVTATITMSTGTASSISVGLGVRFVA